jgi:hypothetical protein
MYRSTQVYLARVTSVAQTQDSDQTVTYALTIQMQTADQVSVIISEEDRVRTARGQEHTDDADPSVETKEQT